ncbi:EAL domain-containing protein [Aquincola sp. S2]|uniref:EAL domain-containing protein n=1 Tax=Pseudaquabacterium terrae TaxID=2732868 RepID=A0ABX2EIU0_9BURK|nr:EAL domain-containing protein [Aquabacterium terrae]NRF68547.1 EAL domain-containing protein [Aquabacterium terrae]
MPVSWSTVLSPLESLALSPAAALLLRWLGRFAAALSLLIAAGMLGRAFPSAGPLLWPLSGVALAVLLRWGSAQLPAVALAVWVVAWSAEASPWLALAITVGSTAGPWLAARWLARANFSGRLEQYRDLGLLLGAGVFGASLLSAANGAVWLAVAGRIGALELPIAWLQRWIAETLGLLVAGLPLLAFSTRSWSRAFDGGNRLITPLLLAGSLAATIAAVLLAPGGTPATFAWLMLPPVLLCALALRSGLAVASAGVLVLCSGLLLATAAGAGPFAALPGGSPAVLLWAYSAALVAVVLLPHVSIGELARLEERSQLALEGSDLGVADWNLQTGDGFTSRRWRALMDDPSGMQTATIERWLARVHPDERAALRSVLAAVDGSPQGAGLRHEARLRVRDAWCWFDVHVTVVERDDTGEPVRVLASLADIGARRSAEDRQRLSSNLFMHLHEGLLITDAEFRVLDANPTYSRITGVPREELLGSVPSLLRPVAPDAFTRQQQASLWAALRSSGNWVGEIVERRRSGDPCALHVTVSAVHGPDGALRYHVLVVSDVTEQRLQHERMERQANFDELTRLPNRARLSQLLVEAMASTDREGFLMAVCYLDLDHFKAINERFGHQAGDRLLAELAARLRTALRARGTAWSDVIARLGGDEFALLLRAGTVDEARSAVERVLRVVAQPFVLTSGGDPIVITASVGATLYPLDGSDADTLLRHADHAMYGAKQSGRNGYLFFDPEHSRLAEERVVAIGRVQEALDHDELTLYYQPKVDLKRGVVLGVEALLRWNHPEHGLVPPAQFLPLIEHTGLSARIGDHVLARALDQLDAWSAEGLDLSVSVNISARHLQEPDFAQRLAELLARHERPLGPRLELEVLETAALTDIGFTSSLLERCARLGVRWALDDFGTGYSTLTYLKRLPLQVLKIDRSFVANMLTDAQDRAIVEGVISLARTFDCTAVAEGVETPAQARLLLDMGCEVGQGAGIAAPMPAAEVAGWVREWRGLFALAAAPAVPPPQPGARRAPGSVLGGDSL